MPQLGRQLLAELLGTALLLAAVVGSGIMGEKLAQGNVAVALLANSLATGGALVALILALGPVSGAHFNPVVSAFEAVHGRMNAPAALAYALAQFLGAVAGVLLAHAMFGLPLVQGSLHVRASFGEFLGEAVATFGLLLTIWGVSRSRPDAAAYAVAAYIVGAYWFTSSTSFANPAATVARGLTSTFAGIEWGSVPGFFLGQIAGLLLAFGVVAAFGEGSGRKG